MNERVAKAIDAVRLFSRFNDWTSDHVPGLPVEVCRYGTADEPEIVVVERFPASVGEEAAIRLSVSKARALAAIKAMREPTAQMKAAGAALYRDMLDHDRTGEAAAWHIFTGMMDAALSAPQSDASTNTNPKPAG